MTDIQTEQDKADQAMARILDALHAAWLLPASPPKLWMHEAETIISEMIAKAKVSP